MDETDRPVTTGPFSIQWIDTSPPPPCAVCRRQVGNGPVGFSKGHPAGPLCDICLVDLNVDLGMLLWLAHIAREGADITAVDLDHADMCMIALTTIAHMLHRGAAWPARMPSPDSATREARAEFPQVPWKRIKKSLATRTN